MRPDDARGDAATLGDTRWRLPASQTAVSRIRERVPNRNLSGMDIDALETSFDLVAPKGDELMEIFYANLFAVAPSVKPLFAGTDMARQRRCCCPRSCCCASRCATSTRRADAKRLGARHVAYGARPEHYPVVGSVLIGAMAHVAGQDWEPRFAKAWNEAFGVVAGAMLDGAAEAELAMAA